MEGDHTLQEGMAKREDGHGVCWRTQRRSPAEEGVHGLINRGGEGDGDHGSTTEKMERPKEEEHVQRLGDGRGLLSRYSPAREEQAATMDGEGDSANGWRPGRADGGEKEIS